MPASPYLYLIIFGEFETLATKTKLMGPSLSIGHTIGEEVFFERVNSLLRKESVISKAPSCVLQIPEQFISSLIGTVSGESSKDSSFLHYTLKNSYRQKNSWRKMAGLFTTPMDN